MPCAMAAAAQQSSFDKPRWLEALAAEFGATLNAGSGSGSDWESEDEDEQLTNGFATAVSRVLLGGK